jgi:hypothetical protein
LPDLPARSVFNWWKFEKSIYGMNKGAVQIVPGVIRVAFFRFFRNVIPIVVNPHDILVCQMARRTAADCGDKSDNAD